MKVIVLNGNVVVNAEQITWVEQVQGQTRINFGAGQYILTELTPGEVRQLIEEADD